MSPGDVSWSQPVQDLLALSQPRSGNAYWLNVVGPQLPEDGVITMIGQSEVSVWAIHGPDTTEYLLGFSRPMQTLPVRGTPDVLPVNMLPQNTHEVIFRIIPFSQQPYPIRLHYLTQQEFDDGRLVRRSSRVGYHLFLGAGILALLFLSGFVLFFFYQNRQRAYLFYGLYMISMAFYFIRLLEYHYEEPVFWGFFFEGYGLAEIVALMLSYVMYVQFVREFLSLDSGLPGILKFIRVWVILCLAFATIGIALSLVQVSSAAFLHGYTGFRFVMPAFVVYFLWRIYQARLPFSSYIIFGTIFLLTGGLLALTVTFLLRNSGDMLLREPFFYMLSGVLLESFCFALGLGKQARQTELDKVSAQQQLISQLQREAQLERDIRESHVQALRAQMNPHFIFNALNSIQHFILSNQKEMSVRYLSRVSQLIRRVLHNSTTPSLTLDEELQTLNAYVEIEQLRFHPAFRYQCTIDDDVDIEMVRIPHLMIQPFIENAIVHGLPSKKDQGVLALEVRLYNAQAVEVIITDNGIGREEAAKQVRQNPGKHNSISSGSIEARIRLLIPDEPNPVVIEDLVDDIGEAIGTRVRLRIPLV